MQHPQGPGTSRLEYQTPPFPSPRLARSIRAGLGGLCVLGALGFGAPMAVAQNLLVNPDFEQGLVGWSSACSGSAVVLPYGSPQVAGTDAAFVIGGQTNQNLLRADDYEPCVEQVVDLGSQPEGTLIRAAGYFGGYAGYHDAAHLVVEYRGSDDAVLGLDLLDSVTIWNRNHETVLLYREGVFELPANTTQVAVRVQFENHSSGGHFGMADQLLLELDPSPAPVIPPHAEMIHNGGFEEGWTQDSPLSLTAGGWEGGNGTSQIRALDYGLSSPSTEVSTAIEGGLRFLSGAANDATLVQRIDLRGTPTVHQYDLRISAYLGGVLADPDEASVQARFLDATESDITPGNIALGPITRAHRNLETTLMIQEEVVSIPAGTAYLEVALHLDDISSSDNTSLIDNVSAMLVPPTSEPPLPLGVNLIHNSSFEDGSVAGSPLDLNDPDGWFGLTDQRAVLLTYGLTNRLPGPMFAAMNCLEANAIGDGTGNAALGQVLSLEGLEDLVMQGGVQASFEAWLGGYLSNPDEALFRVVFLSEAGVPLWVSELGPATPADRGNATTLLPYAGSTFVPPLARSIRVEARFNALSSGEDFGILDRVRLVLNDGTSLGTRYCTSSPNSTGEAARIVAIGSTSIAANDLGLVAEPVPNQTGLFFYGPDQIQVPFGNGTRCVGGMVGRLEVVIASGCVLSYTLDNTLAPHPLTEITPGSTWNFQAWFRDPMAGGASFDLSDALEITFQP